MNVAELLTGKGFKAFLQTYHQLLNKKHHFPALSGMKPVHRAAEVMDLPSGEALLALLDSQSMSAQTQPLRLVEHQEADFANMHARWSALWREGGYATAREVMGNCVARYPDCPLSLWRLARSQRQMGDKNAAGSHCLQLLSVVEMQQPPLFCWGAARLVGETPLNKSVLSALLTLAGLELEKGGVALARFYLARVERLCVGPSDKGGLFELCCAQAKTILAGASAAVVPVEQRVRYAIVCRALAEDGVLPDDTVSMPDTVVRRKRSPLDLRRLHETGTFHETVSVRPLSVRRMIEKSFINTGRVAISDLQDALGGTAEAWQAFKEDRLPLTGPLAARLSALTGISVEVLMKTETASMSSNVCQVAQE